MQLPFHFCETKTSWCSGLDFSLGAGWEVWRWGQRGRFRHCHPVWAADCEPCRPRSVNLWRTGFLAPPTPPCHEAPGSAPRGRAAPPPESPAPPSYAACTCSRKEYIWLALQVFAALHLYSWLKWAWPLSYIGWITHTAQTSLPWDNMMCRLLHPLQG